MDQFRFLNWQVYKDAREIVFVILRIVNKLPKEYRYELGSQLIRSGFSISLNIAEGSGKNSDKEMNRYFEIALGSIYETVAALDTLNHSNLITDEEFARIQKRLTDIANQLGGFKKKLRLKPQLVVSSKL